MKASIFSYAVIFSVACSFCHGGKEPTRLSKLKLPTDIILTDPWSSDSQIIVRQRRIAAELVSLETSLEKSRYLYRTRPRLWYELAQLEYLIEHDEFVLKTLNEEQANLTRWQPELSKAPSELTMKVILELLVIEAGKISAHNIVIAKELKRKIPNPIAAVDTPGTVSKWQLEVAEAKGKLKEMGFTFEDVGFKFSPAEIEID